MHVSKVLTVHKYKAQNTFNQNVTNSQNRCTDFEVCILSVFKDFTGMCFL